MYKLFNFYNQGLKIIVYKFPKIYMTLIKKIKKYIHIYTFYRHLLSKFNLDEIIHLYGYNKLYCL